MRKIKEMISGNTIMNFYIPKVVVGTKKQKQKQQNKTKKLVINSFTRNILLFFSCFTYNEKYFIENIKII